MRPFLRWAGGKRWLVTANVLNISTSARYVEPFLGGGAVFFAQPVSRAILSDLNPFLINAYKAMRDATDDLFALVAQHFSAHSSEHYYKTRSSLGRETVPDAAAFIYLNRSCFNGLFRVNLAGQFNVPIGTKAYELSDICEFHRWSQRLEGVHIAVADFEETIDQCGQGDVIFVDPPYTVKHNNNGFIEYNEKIFGWEDQVRLANCLERADGRGAAFILTNADHESVRALYPGRLHVSQTRGSEMAGRSSFRGKTSELMVVSSSSLITNPLL